MASRRFHRRPRSLRPSQLPENIRAMLLVSLLLVVPVALLVDTRTIVSVAARQPVFVVARQSLAYIVPLSMLLIFLLL